MPNARFWRSASRDCTIIGDLGSYTFTSCNLHNYFGFDSCRDIGGILYNVFSGTLCIGNTSGDTFFGNMLDFGVDTVFASVTPHIDHS